MNNKTDLEIATDELLNEIFKSLKLDKILKYLINLVDKLNI